MKYYSLVVLSFLFVFSHANAETFYFHNDAIGTPQVVTDSQKEVVWKANHSPFGNAEIVTEEIEMNLRQPGQYYDKETGLHYNYFRTYDPATGRYLQSDPIGLEASINTYAYVDQNPINAYDPYGLEKIYTTTEGVELYAYPKPTPPSNRGEHARKGEGSEYHVHVNQHPKKRWDVYNNRPLTEEDAKNFTKKELRACRNLSQNEQWFIKKATREVFHRNPSALASLRSKLARRMASGLGALGIYATSNSFEESCAKDFTGDLADACY